MWNREKVAWQSGGLWRLSQGETQLPEQELPVRRPGVSMPSGKDSMGQGPEAGGSLVPTRG